MSARKDINFFKFNLEESGEGTYVVPNTTTENTDSISFTSNWTTVNIQGSTEAVSAFNYVNNPTIPINLKFSEDMWREYPEDLKNHTYEETVAMMAALQYPIESGSKILPPYCKIHFNGYIYRGYFTNVRITESGPFRTTRADGSKTVSHRTICEFNGQFTIVKKSNSPSRRNIASAAYKTYFQ